LFSNRAIFWLVHGSVDEKRLILATVGSNPTLIGKNLSIDARKPFLTLQKQSGIRDWWRVVRDVRTFFCEEPEFVIPMLPAPGLELNIAA